MKQRDARARAKQLTSETKGKRQFIAGTVPLNAWGGRERGWAVYVLENGKLSWVEGTPQ